MGHDRAGARAAKRTGPARDQVYAWLRDAIISGEIEGGRFLA